MKYIIELEDEPYMREDGVNYYTCKSARWYKLGETIINRLTPYTEPDLNPLVDEAVEAIENEVWEFARAINYMEYDDFVSCFGGKTEEVVYELSYSEVKTQYEAWKKIHVGDEIVGIYSDGEKTPPLVVLKVEGNYYYGIYSKTGEFVQGGLNYEKTGRHFPEVVEMLKKMKEELNDN